MSDEQQELDLIAEARAAIERLRTTAKQSRLVAATARPLADDFDLSALAAKAGMSLGAIMATPDGPRFTSPAPYDVRLGVIAKAEIPREHSDRILAGQLLDVDPPNEPNKWRALRAAREWIAGPGWTIALCGDVGRGKTLGLCAAYVEDAMRRRRGARAAAVARGASPAEQNAVADAELTGGYFCTAEDLVSPLTSPEVSARARAAKVLILDEMGREALTQVGLARIGGLLSYRHSQRLKTGITSQLARRREKPTDPPQWAERYGDWLDDRIVDEWEALAGPSLRGAR